MAAQLLEQPMVGEQAPPFKLTSTDGETFDLAGQRGRFVVVHFGTSW